MNMKKWLVLVWLGLLPGVALHAQPEKQTQVAVFAVSDAVLPLRTVEVATGFTGHLLLADENISVVSVERLEQVQRDTEIKIDTQAGPTEIAEVLQAMDADRAIVLNVLKYQATSGVELTFQNGVQVVAELVIHDEESTIRMVISGDITPAFLFALLLLLSQTEAELALQAQLYDRDGTLLATATEQQATTMDKGGEVLAEMIQSVVAQLLPSL